MRLSGVTNLQVQTKSKYLQEQPVAWLNYSGFLRSIKINKSYIEMTNCDEKQEEDSGKSKAKINKSEYKSFFQIFLIFYSNCFDLVSFFFRSRNRIF